MRQPKTVYRTEALLHAQENLKCYDWARQVLDNMRSSTQLVMDRGMDYVVQMIPETTPGGLGFTNCASCEGNAIHGAYDWDAANPESMTCTTCGLVYPNEKYPEDVAFVASKHGNGQTITFHSGYAFEFHGFHLRSSWSAQIRAQKVSYMSSQALSLAKVFALTGERAYGEKACAILKRFAQVYPGYLVHSSYGEWIDLPPRQVAECINNLPEDEWTMPPNKPDRKLHSGYWNSGRATGFGMEGTFVRQMTVAYDLVYELLTEAERANIKRDLLLESTVLLLADPALNNKSVSNLTAAGLVGMAVGDPVLVRAGIKGFRHFIDNWFLADGTTSESPAYGMMTLSGLRDFGEALHGYTDPADYRAADRLADFDVYGDAKCQAVFRSLYDTLFPNLKYPAWADSYVTTSPGLDYVELMAARYQLPEYRALLGELLEGPPAQTGGETALWIRDPDFAVKKTDHIVFDDVFFPALRMGFLRLGKDGRRGTAILDASHWGVHHHRDSLNVTLFDEGHEVLTDLGYLWDRPDKDMTVRTAAHNLVVVDESEQRTKERLGSLHLFDTTSRIKVVSCSSQAYAQCDTYQRTCLWVDHGDAGGYLVDVFDVSGGSVHDALFHGPTPDVQIDGIGLSGQGPGPYDLCDVKVGTSSTPWCVRWHMDEAVTFRAWILPSAGETVLIGKGWGERGWGHFNTPDKRVPVPYLIRRRQAANLKSTFVSLFEVGRGTMLVSQVAPLVGGTGVVVTTSQGVDVIAFGPVSSQTPLGVLTSDGAATVVSGAFLYLLAGTHAKVGNRSVRLTQAFEEGSVGKFENGSTDAWFEAVGLNESAGLIGKTILIDDGVSVTGYIVRDVKGNRIYTRHKNKGFDFIGGKTWRVVHSVCEAG